MRQSSTLVAVRLASSSRGSLAVAMGLAAGAAFSLTGAAQAQYVWVGPVSGNFSVGTNWQGGIAPPNASPSTTLRFDAGNVAAITATQNIGTPFQVNAMTFANASPFTVAGTAGNVFQMTGPSPAINLSGLGDSTLSGTGAALQLADDLTFGGSGIGNLTIAGAIGETGGARRVTIPALPASMQGTPMSQTLHTVILGSGTSSYTGGLTLDGGNMRTAGFGGAANIFGPAGSTFTVTGNGGVIQNVASLSSGITASTFQLNGTLRVVGAGSNFPLTTTLLNGNGTLAVNGTSSTAMSIQSNSTGYTGAVVIDRSSLPQFNAPAGGIGISGSNGAIINVPSIDIRAGGSINLTSTAAAFNNNRLGDTTPLNFRSGNLTMAGATGAAFTETVGAITGGGYSTITASPGASGVTTLAGASLAREDRGTFLFRGTALGGSAAVRGHVTFASAPAGLSGGGGAAGTTGISILPYAIGDITGSGTGTSFVTYDAAGIRPLNTATEYAIDLVSGATTNARLAAAAANAGSTVNALAIATGGSVTGAGTLNVTSGAILNTSTTGNIGLGNTVAFGAAEGHIYSAGSTAVLTVDGQLTGSNGLTKSGPGQLVLTNDNSGLTGQLTVNAGYINFNSANALPGTGQIVANGTGGGASTNAAGLTYSGAAPLDLTRDIFVNSGFLNARCAAAGQSLTLSGQVTGAGGLFIETPVGSDVYLTNTSNSYTGVTFINGGNVHIPSDAVFGNGGALDMTATMTLDGNWTTSRMVNFNSGTAAAVLNTNGFDATLDGPIGCYTTALTNQTAGVLNKNGAGTLNITSNINTYVGGLNVNGGTVLVNGTLPASLVATSAITVNTGAALGGSGSIYRNVNVAAGGTLAPGNSPGILFVGGNVALAAGGTLAMEIAGAAAGNGPNNHDQLRVDGTVNVTGAALNAAMGFWSATDGSALYWLVTNDGIDAVTGTFAGLPEGGAVSLGTFGGVPFSAQISYTGNSATGMVDGTGNDIVLYNVVPAPATTGLLVMGGLLAARRRRSSI